VSSSKIKVLTVGWIDFAASSGNVTDEVIKQYIEAQGKQPPDDKDNFQVTEL